MRSAGVIFENKKNKNTRTHKKQATTEVLKGDSGVGQAPESSFRPLVSPFFVKVKSLLLRRQPKAMSRQGKYKNESLYKRKTGKFFYSARFFSRLGTALIIFSILGFLLTYGPIIQVEIGYRLSQLFEKKGVPRGSFSQLLDKTLLGETDGVPDPNFSLVIPKIHAKGKIIPNVDPANEIEYFSALKTGIAHAKGTTFPGGGGTIYLFAHSTDSPVNILRYNAVFYLLKEMEVGDGVDIYYSGARHRYTVTDKKIVEPTDVSYLSATNEKGKELLILQTCWPPGTTLRRLLIFAEKLKV